VLNKPTSEYEKRLEAAIDRELKGLPEFSAPANLVSRVMSAVAARAALPWYRQSWQAWPASLRTAALVMLLAFFGALCFGTWEIWQGATFAAVLHKFGAMFSSVATLATALGTILSAALLLVKQLGTAVIIGLLLAVAFGYAMCIGLGTVYWKLAYSRS
jgi:hypothetical protein